MATFGMGYMAKLSGHLGTGGTDGLLKDVGPLLDDGLLQGIFVGWCLVQALA